MQSRWLVLSITALLLPLWTNAQQSSTPPLTNTYVNHECRVQFRYPAEWHVAVRKDCQFRIDSSASVWKDDDMSTSGVTISIVDKSFEDAAQDTGYELRDGQWFYRGEGEVTADPLKGSPYKGLFVDDFPCRIYDAKGYVGLGDCAAAIVGDKGRAASFYSDPETIELLPRIVQSFRFEPRK